MTNEKPSNPPLDPGPHVLSQPLVDARRRLLDLAPGASRARPFEVGTAAVIEPKAMSIPCPRCSGAFEVVVHAAHLGARLREVQVACRHCGERRTVWFRINAAS